MMLLQPRTQVSYYLPGMRSPFRVSPNWTRYDVEEETSPGGYRCEHVCLDCGFTTDRVAEMAYHQTRQAEIHSSWQRFRRWLGILFG